MDLAVKADPDCLELLIFVGSGTLPLKLIVREHCLWLASIGQVREEMAGLICQGWVSLDRRAGER